jgi:hypothetical protein
MSGIVGNNTNRGSGIVKSAAVGADSIDGSNIADDAIDSEHLTAASVDNEHLADNAVGLDEMAGNTDGVIISFDASGDPVAVGPGSDGEVLTSTGAGSPPAFEAAGGGGFTLGTEQATTSGTSITFSGIPAGVTMIVINLLAVSFTSSTDLDITIGDSGGLETSGYNSCSSIINHASAIITNSSVTGFMLNGQSGSDTFRGQVILTLEDASAFTWVESHSCYLMSDKTIQGGGDKTLSGEITQLSIFGGTFDAGAVNIMYI